MGRDFKFDDGLFSGYDEAKRTYDSTTWDYDRLPPVTPVAAGSPAPAAQPPGSSGGASALGGAAGGASGGSPAAVAGLRAGTGRLRQDRPDAAATPGRSSS